ncbi:D-alanine--D-alanine ligase [Bacteroidales bacterium OttesenSCG-928-A17]|nr:D-alanine--D-alanine ligase [Bacteroidales bacterium OttesenSCG-928-A17]
MDNTSNKKNIAIVAGGYSSEYVISLKSAEGIYSFIDPDRYNLYIVLITKDKWIVQKDGKEFSVDKNDFSFIEDGQKTNFDFAYITIHGTPGENGLIQGYLQMLDIPFSCCDVLAASLSFNKFVCNQYLKTYGISIADSIWLKTGESVESDEIVNKLGLPVFVKPNDGGSSFATTKVNEKEKLQEAIALAFGEGKEVIIEQFIPGTEVTCGCYKVGGKETVFPITEVVSKNEFFDFDAKYNPASVEEITPARISPELTEKIQKMTSRVYDYLGANGIIRVDYIITPAGEVKMLEVNTTPGMTKTSFIPQQIRAAGLDIREVMTEIIEGNRS